VNANEIYCNHPIGWYNDDVFGIEFMTALQINEFALQRREHAKSMMSFAPADLIKHHVALLAMTDNEIIESHVCQFKFCPSCVKSLQQITLQNVTTLGSAI
jgi:hypothetical protein